MRPLGKNQLHLLQRLGCPSIFLVIPNKESRSLVKRGLVRAFGNDSFFAITPAGLRALANVLESGKIEQKFPKKDEASS